jgi:antitoxin component of MazEF toxin-antitoxin module
MIKTLRRQGNGQVLPIDKATMEAMGIELDTPLQVTVTGNVLVVTPVHVGLSREEIDASLAKLRGRYGQTLRNLAVGPSDK